MLFAGLGSVDCDPCDKRHLETASGLPDSRGIFRTEAVGVAVVGGQVDTQTSEPASAINSCDVVTPVEFILPGLAARQ